MSHSRQIKRAILFTDLVHSVELWETDKNKMASIIKYIDDMVFAIVLKHKGRVIKTIGDAAMASFINLENALKAASEIQSHMGCKNFLIKDKSVQLRIGVSYGHVTEHSMTIGDSKKIYKLPDIIGPVVNLASRAESYASNPGEIAIGLFAKSSQKDLDIDDIYDIANKIGLEQSKCKKKLLYRIKRIESQSHNASQIRSARLLSARNINQEVVKGFFNKDVTFSCWKPIQL
jgi:hypothetical protein